MESTGVAQGREKVVNQAMSNVTRRPPVQAPAKPAEETRRRGYGMPCANCSAYYPSDLPACPICQCKERVAPSARTQAAPAAATPQSVEAKLLAEERERLRALKSEIYASQSPVAPAAFRCALDQNHNGNTEAAAVCHSCYSAARQQSDRMEAALHMDTNEAAKIVYDAVWADSSDPNRTYLNAAHALLSELRRRAGVGLLLGSNQPFAH